jgi:CBS domain-containing membrane protein
VATIQTTSSRLHAWRLLRSRRLPALVVVDSLGRVDGLLSLDNFVHATRAHSPAGLRDRLVLLLRHHMGRDHGVTSIMSVAPVTTVAEAHIATLVPLLAGRVHFVPVVDANRQLLGVVTQSDLIAALYQRRLAQGE